MEVQSVGIVGATGALGVEVANVLKKSRFSPDRLVALASAATTTSHVNFGDERVAVDDPEDQVWDELDGVILACPPEVAEKWGSAVLAEGVPMVDCSGAMVASGAPLCVPWVNPGVVGAATHRALSLPSPEAILLSSILGPLARAGVVGDVICTMMVPASRSGRKGIEELSRQVTALFNSQPPPRKIFTPGLAFDLIPLQGADSEHGSQLEVAISESSRAVSAFEGPVSVSRVVVPVFSGLCADIFIGGARGLNPSVVAKLLSDGGVQIAHDQKAPSPRRMEGQPFVQAARIRNTEHGLRLWATMDNLAASAAVCVSSLAALLQAEE